MRSFVFLAVSQQSCVAFVDAGFRLRVIEKSHAAKKHAHRAFVPSTHSSHTNAASLFSFGSLSLFTVSGLSRFLSHTHPSVWEVSRRNTARHYYNIVLLLHNVSDLGQCTSHERPKSTKVHHYCCRWQSEEHSPYFAQYCICISISGVRQCASGEN